MKVVLVCFAGTCRSPTAAQLLRAASGDRVEVLARGMVGGDARAPDPLVTALVEAGLDPGVQVGATLRRDEAREADLLLFMARDLLREAAVADPVIWPKSFTLREFARRAYADPPNGSDATFGAWLAVLHSRRSPEDLVGRDRGDDVADPGLFADVDAYREMIIELADVVNRAVPFLLSWPSS